jgi:small subunit ribosomal protein S16
MVPETDARAILNAERIDYWLNVGAQPSEKVRVLIRKYGSQGTHLDQQRQALEKLKQRPQAPSPQPVRVATQPSESAPAEADQPAPAEAVSESADE